MLLAEFDNLIRNLLNLDTFIKVDNALNGLQVDRETQEIHCVAFAVDASMESFRRARAAQADILFVHHGLFWGKPLALRNNLYERIKFLLANDLALYAVHLPLDAHPALGNNFGMAEYLRLSDLEPFGDYKGIKIGFKGSLEEPRRLNEIAELICDNCPGVLPFGTDKIRKIGIISGSYPVALLEAIVEGLELFITGETSHTIYHDCLEAKINVIFAGHYKTEKWGIKKMSEYCQQSMDIKTVLLDIPTGL